VIGTFWVVPRPAEVHGVTVPRAGVSGRRPLPLTQQVRAPSSVVRPLRSLGPRGPSLHRPPAVSNAPADLAIRSTLDANAFLGVWRPLRDISRRRPLAARAPTLQPDGPSSAFRTPSAVCSVTDLAGLFHPAATSRVDPSGVCSLPRSRTGFPRPIALCPLRHTRLRLPAPSEMPSDSGRYSPRRVR